MSLRVMFRVDRESGQVYALLPDIPGEHPGQCELYASDDGRAIGALSVCMDASRPAEAREYRALLDEMREEYDTDLRVIERCRSSAA